MTDLSSDNAVIKRIPTFVFTALCLAMGTVVSGCDGNPEIEVKAWSEGLRQSVVVTNVGRAAIQIDDVLINDRSECSKFVQGTYVPFESNKLPTRLNIGEKGQYWTSCEGQIIRVRIKTDKGEGTYSF